MQALLSGADRKKAAQSAAKFREETSRKASLIGCTTTYCTAQWTCKGKRPCRIIRSEGYAVCDPDHTLCRNLLPGRKFMPTVKNPLTAVSFPARSTHQSIGALPDGRRDTPTPSCYAVTGWRRTESGRPAASIRFSTATPMEASVCCAAKPRARRRGPISAL
jgi:hypothetical protein